MDDQTRPVPGPGPRDEAARRIMASRAAQQPHSQQVTDALADAVRRARAATGAHAPEPEPAEITEPVPVVAAGDPPRAPAPAARPRAGSAPRWLVRGAVAVAALAVLLGAADLALLLGGHRSPPAPHRSAAVPTLPPASSTTTRPAPSSSTSTTSTTPSTTTKPSTTTTSTSTTTTTPAPAAAGPRLASISPARGRPGTVVTLHGSGFVSPRTGQVVARVDGQPAPTQCPTRSSCEVTIPQLGGRRRTVSVTVTTDAGSSNALWFRYLPG